jgi:hypothetical protein
MRMRLFAFERLLARQTGLRYGRGPGGLNVPNLRVREGDRFRSWRSSAGDGPFDEQGGLVTSPSRTV